MVQRIPYRLGQRDSKSLAPQEHFFTLVGSQVQIAGIRMPRFGVPVKVHQSESRRQRARSRLSASTAAPGAEFAREALASWAPRKRLALARLLGPALAGFFTEDDNLAQALFRVAGLRATYPLIRRLYA